jgi:FAD/FMN-containing dehydrogenase
MSYESWGRAIPSIPSRAIPLPFAPAALPNDDLLLPYGLGRSYGDVCLNNGHTLLDTAKMDHFRRFDAATGIIECEAGASLDAILAAVVPRGWFLPVTPGTKFVTVGGCIANDVHGKNHHRAGTFGRHVRSLELLRSDGSLLHCSPAENPQLFSATIGGLGLTGLIVTAEIALRKIESRMIVAERIPFRTLAEFDELSRAADATHDYSVAWFDSASGRDPRGIFFRGNHASAGGTGAPASAKSRRLPVRLFSPFLMPLTVRLFNQAYFRANAHPHPQTLAYDPFFYPLDAVSNWNAIYGSKGFLQYQFVLPGSVAEVLDRVAKSQLASFLTVIKRFGSLPSPGMMSFPREGTTVCFDFAEGSPRLRPLLEELDRIVLEGGGAVYPAKDLRMSPETFRRSFPQFESFAKFVDPRFSSTFWRRVT